MTPREVREAFRNATQKIGAGSNGRSVVTASMTPEPLGLGVLIVEELQKKHKHFSEEYRIGDKYIRRVAVA